MTASRTRRTWSLLLGLGLAVLALYVLLSVVGIGAVIGALRSADPLAVGIGVLLAICWMSAWGYTLHLVFGVLDVSTTRWQSFLVYLTTMFANNVAPFSVGGGEPIAALLVSRSTRTPYETAFLSVVSTDVVNFLPAPAFAFVGLLYVLTTATLGRQLETVVTSLVTISGLLVLLGALGWRYRRRIVVLIASLLTRVHEITTRILPGVRLPSPVDLHTRIETFVDGLERVTGDRRVLVLGLGSSALGWVLHAAVLWTSLYAVGANVQAVIPLFVVTIVTVTDVIPLPGGLGSVDAVLVVLLVTLTGVPAATVTAGTLVFRGTTLLFPIVLGGVTVVALHLASPDRNDLG